MSSAFHPSSPATLPFVHSPEDGSADDRSVGGKGTTLCALAEAGFPVPPFFCVTTRALDEILRPYREELSAGRRRLGMLEADEGRLKESVRELAEVAGRALRDGGLSEEARAAVEAGFDRHFRSGARVAIRSSVVGEDSARDSFAGQMDTFLFVAPDELCDRVADCLASAFSERALLYRHARELLERPIRAGVVIQEMVLAEKSGVAFTAEPVSGDPSVVVVSAGYGLGEGVVGDHVEVDTYRARKADGKTRHRAIGVKTRRLVRDEGAGQGTRMDEVPERLREAPVLSDEELKRLVELAGRLESWSGAPCDLEWSLDEEGTLWLLQSRPLTTGVEGRLTILDNSNIVESYPGVSSPLTFSFVRRGYAETFREGLRMIGVSERTLDGRENLFENLVAYVRGRIYYNILNWYRLFDLMGLEKGVPAWERALGLSRGDPRRSDRGSEAGRPGPWRRAYIRLRIGAHLFTRGGAIRGYVDLLEREEEKMRARDLASTSPHELLDLFGELTERLLAPYGVTVVNDLFAQQLYGLTGRLVERWRIGDPERLLNALVVGTLRSDAVLPVRSLTTLADQVRANPSWREAFEAESDPDALWDRIRRRPELAELRERIERHVARFGDRTVHELKLETPSLREEPAFALNHLRRYVLVPPSDAASDPASLAREAEEEVRRRLRFRPLRRLLFFRVLRRTREALRYRERLRLARTRAFGLVKDVFVAMGSHFSRDGLLAERDDVFFLTVDEIEGAVRGRIVTEDLRALTALRKREYERFQQEEDPPSRIVVRGSVGAMSPPRRDSSPSDVSVRELRGEGCSPGVATGPARVVRKPREHVDAEGAILVAPATDPGWVFLMLGARGLVVERGSVLSHTAIVGRELGIPTVVGVPDAVRRIRDGDLVRIDGSSGMVRILERASDDRAEPEHPGST